MPTDITAKNPILSASLAKRKIRRMAFEIAENNASESSIVILGINGNGEVLAASLASELQSITSLTIETSRIIINKKFPLDGRLGQEISIDGKVVIVADDVSNTGRTLLYALKPLLSHQPKKIQTVVLVERSHKSFAVQPDYVGLSISTTLQEHISVETSNGVITGAWLH
jgi:pyrimidine operon attenuation protein / uracil phosphoribosyltransferase